MSSSLLVFLALELLTFAGGSWDDDPPAASSLESLVPTWCALGWKRVAVVAPPPGGGGEGPYSKTEVFFTLFKNIQNIIALFFFKFLQCTAVERAI